MLSAQRPSVGAHGAPFASPSSDQVSRHKCLIYDGEPSEQLPVVVPFMLDGLRSNWRCLYVGNPQATQMIEHALLASGLNTVREESRGALVMSSDRSHLSTGVFNPRQMLDWLSQAIDDALKAGFVGLCATGDMRWELGDDDNFEFLLDYEAGLEQLFRDKPLRGICQYHRDIVPPQALRHALVTHRSAYLGAALKTDNFFYVPPELISDPHAGGTKVGEWMCEQIIRVLDAESARDQAMIALKESEAQQRQLAEQLSVVNRDLDLRVQERTFQLQQSNRELEAFAYSVSHDLRSPLHHINGFASLLEEVCDDRLDEKERNYLSRIQAGTKQMAELIDDLLRLGKLAQAELKIAKVQLSTIATNIIGALRFTAPDRQVEVSIESNIEVQGDPGLLRLVLQNLLSNAWKYTSRNPHAKIEFGAISENDGTIFFVRDNGAGFDMKQAGKLFTPFRRLHKDEEFDGHGIGLATVQRIIKRHDGKVWANAEPGKGATFFFTLNRPEPGKESLAAAI